MKALNGRWQEELQKGYWVRDNLAPLAVYVFGETDSSVHIHDQIIREVRVCKRTATSPAYTFRVPKNELVYVDEVQKGGRQCSL